jgi:hypothetical protein
MGKPLIEVFEKCPAEIRAANQKYEKKTFLVPYLKPPTRAAPWESRKAGAVAQ